MIKINFTNNQRYLTVNKTKISKLFKSILKKHKRKHCSVSLVFVDNKEIKRINRKFLKSNRITDVIAFPLGDERDDLLGEVIISAQEALIQSRKRKIKPSLELTLYCVHGLLHLLGYDDIKPTKRKKMWKKQEEILGRF